VSKGLSRKHFLTVVLLTRLTRLIHYRFLNVVLPKMFRSKGCPIILQVCPNSARKTVTRTQAPRRINEKTVKAGENSHALTVWQKLAIC
jgi:hypothetical protein